MLSFEEKMFLKKAKNMYKIAKNIAPSDYIDLFQIGNVKYKESHYKFVFHILWQNWEN